MAYSPRKRARSEIPHINSWPEGGDSPKIQGFVGYKAGMTHALVVDYRPTSTTSGMEVQIPVTVVETPSMGVAAIRFYGRGDSGMEALGEEWSKVDKELSKNRKVGKPGPTDVDPKLIEEIRILAYTKPKVVTSLAQKSSDLVEFRVGGDTLEKRIEYARTLLGKEITVRDFIKEGDMIDVIGVTKGKGFQGSVKRWGVKLQHHKNSKNRRDVGTLGPWHPPYVRSTVPQAGQTGYHQRVEFNKRILKISGEGAEIIPKGGFLNYGEIGNDYVVIHGTIPGPAKRLIKLRDPVRRRGVDVGKPELTYISLASKQGV